LVRQRAAGWSGSVATYSRGGKVAQTLALMEAQVQAAPFSSAINSFGVGLRSRLKTSTKVVPVHWLPARLVGTALGDNQRARAFRALARRRRMVLFRKREKVNQERRVQAPS
jgi:hypothetical protein